jgi:hypothetical protein
MKASDKLKEIIRKQLESCDTNALPRLKKYVSTDSGMESAAAMIYKMCSRDGMPVQSAMSNLDSEL